jgi:AsmA protein
MRIVIKLVLLLAVVFVSALIAIPFVVNPNDYKQEISDQVEKATGRQLTLEGDIGLSVFPWIALELGPLSLSNAKGFDADAFARVKAAEVRIKLMPLLNKQLEMDTIILDGLTLNLEKNKVGATNWDDLAGPSEAPKAKTTASASQDASAALAAVSIAGIELTDANVNWSDKSANQQFTLQNFNLTTEPLNPGKPTALALNFKLSSTQPKAEVEMALTSKVNVDLENQTYALTDLTLSTKANGSPELGFTSSEIELLGDISADMAKQVISAQLTKLSSKINTETQSVEAELSTNISSNLSTQVTELKQLELTALIQDPALPSGRADVKLTSDIKANLLKQTVSVSSAVLSVYDLLINADIEATSILNGKPAYAGTLNLASFSPRKLANQLAIELPVMSDDTTLESAELKAQFNGSTTHFDATKLELSLDQTHVSGQFAITDFAKQALKFALSINGINVDRYLPPETENKPVAAPASSAAAGATQLPLETLRQINAQGTIDINELTVSGTHSSNIHLEINAKNGAIKLSPLSANLYEGSYQGSVNLDAQSDKLKLSINEQLKNVQAGPLLKDLQGEETISGLANAQVKLTGQGLTVDEIKQTLTGNGQFSFTDGALQGINIGQSIRKARAVIKGETLPESDEPVKTDFSSLSGSFTAQNGVINNQDLAAMSPLLRINGAGDVDIVKESINYGLKVAVVGTSKGQDGKSLEDLKGLTIPVKISGTFSQPKPNVDLGALLKDKATEEVKSKVADKLKEKVGGDLGGLLGGALGSQDTQTETASETTESEAQPTETQPSLEDQAKDALQNKLKSFF